MHDGEYESRVEQLYREAAAELKEARNSPTLRTVLAAFFKHWTAEGFSIAELVDFLGVSSPSILERAGFTQEEELNALDIAAKLTDEEIARAGR